LGKDIVIGTRGSKLALWQAKNLQSQLKSIGVESTLNIIKTKGDKIQDLSFDKIEGKGFFTKEIEDALLLKEADIAVHSLKDLPTESPDGLILSGLSEREDPSDLLIINKSAFNATNVLNIKEKAVIGTSSIRRKTQIQDLLPTVTVKDLRGNVPTRVSKLNVENYDAIILASAGINRLQLDLSNFETFRLNPKEFVPAPGQGVVAYQTRKEDIDTRKILSKIHNKETALATNVERKILQLMDGGCQLPLGAHCVLDSKGHYHVYAAFSPSEEEGLHRAMLSQSTSLNLAEKMVEKLLN